MMAKDMFIVLATHSTGHGDSTNPVIITEDIYAAVGTTRNIVELGYKFHTTEHAVCVYKLMPNRLYKKNDFMWYTHQEPPEHCIVTFRYVPGEHCWNEEWHDKEAKYIVDDAR